MKVLIMKNSTLKVLTDFFIDQRSIMEYLHCIDKNFKENKYYYHIVMKLKYNLF